MSVNLEHDYIDANINTMENYESYKLCGKKFGGLKTELSLGLPGRESPERRPNFTIFGKDFEVGSSGSKRVFSDAIDGDNKWVFTLNNGRCEGNLGNDNYGQKLGGVVKEGSVSVDSSCVLKKEEGVEVSGATAPAAKAQVVGWPPIRSYRKNTMASTSPKSNEDTNEKSVGGCLYVKVSMDGAPYLRKIDLQIYENYIELSSALEKMFTCCITGQYRSHGHGKQDGNEGHSTEHLRTSEYVLTYEDKDGDWMLVGDVPWKMFTENCRKLRIMTGSEAIGLAPYVADKCKVQG